MPRLATLAIAASLLHAADPLPPPDLHAGFDGSAEARGPDGAAIAPTAATGLAFVDGIHGQAVRISAAGGAKPRLCYAGSLIEPAAGTIAMWVRPRWDGTDRQDRELPWRYLVGARGGTLALWFYEFYLRGDLAGADGKPAQLGMACRNAWRAGDWHHVALTWDAGAWSRLIVDGLPYNSGLGGCPAPTMAKALAASAGIAELAVGTAGDGGRPAEADLDDLMVWKRALTPEQIAAIYRGSLLIDATCERRWLAAGAPETVAVQLWPGGALPYLDAAGVVAGPVAIDAELALDGPDGRTVVSERRHLELSGRTVLTLPAPPLAAGAHRARLTWAAPGGAAIQRSWSLTAYVPEPANPDTGPVVRGAPSLDLDCAGTTPAAGSDTTVRTLPGGARIRETAGTSRDERFTYEVAIPEGQYDGRPWEIAFTWPDDRPRTLGLYLYKGTEGTAANHHRDRIEGGVFGGAEFPESGGLVTTRYLFFPWGPKYLAEVRTLVAGLPASLARLTVRPLGARLPRLALDVPADGGRGFGHFDEDQTWEVPLAIDMPTAPLRSLRMADALMDYLDYAGLGMLNYASLRYASAMYDLPGMRCGGGHYFETPGYQGLLLDRAAARGKRVIVSTYLNGIPEVAARPDLAECYRAIGYQRLDRAGQPAKAWDGTASGTPLHPEFRRRLLGHLDEIFARFAAHPACAGFDLWGGDWALRPLQNGFDACTTAAFSRDTGIALPAGDDPAACAARAEILLGARRGDWLRWNAQMNTALVAEIASHLAAAAPRSVLRVTIGGEALQGSADAPSADGLDPVAECLELGVDLAALRAIPNVIPTPMRQSTWDRWQLHWNRQRSTGDEILADVARQGALATPGRTASYSFLRYFESFTKSPLNDVYRSYFQDADAKPHGRYFLKDLAHALIAYDAQELLVGAQSLGTSGREDEAREFARAFRALPRTGFSDLPGSRDPAWVRACRDGADGWWVYAVNAWHAPVAVELALPAAAAVRDLGAGRDRSADGGRLRLDLQPFQLVALRIGRAPDQPSVAAIVPDADALAAARSRADAYAQAIADLAKADAPVAAHQERLARIRTALATGAVAEAHRLWASKPVFALPDELEAARKGFLGERARMVAQGHYAINCGANRYFRTPHGDLFFPDQPWLDGRAGYGFDGPHQAAEHAIDKLVGPVDRFLVFSEAYDVMAYRFAVPAGSYTVRTYNSIGYGPNAAPGKMVMTLAIEGKRVWDRLDLFEALGRDDRQVLVSEFHDIRCTDGVLDLEWRRPDGGGGWVNAIEIVPEAKAP